LNQSINIYIENENVRRWYENIKAGSLLVLDEKGVKSHNMLRTQLITREIREAIRSAGLNMRPYVLRGYFATALDIAESKGLISHPWRMFIMGHKGDIEARYSTNKRLPPDMIEEMRESYKKAQNTLRQQLGRLQRTMQNYSLRNNYCLR
jgi:hypothetical protein